jgi:peroxiredoxin (alkyl hydroperoxide reductase subunit C)
LWKWITFQPTFNPKEEEMVLKVGQPAPDFHLPSHTGAVVKLGDYLGKNIVLAFFPLAWTPI